MQGGRRPTSEQLAQQGGHRPPCTSKRVYAYTFQCVCVYVSSSVRIARDQNRWADFLEIVLLADTWEKVCASNLVPFILFWFWNGTVFLVFVWFFCYLFSYTSIFSLVASLCNLTFVGSKSSNILIQF